MVRSGTDKSLLKRIPPRGGEGGGGIYKGLHGLRLILEIRQMYTLIFLSEHMDILEHRFSFFPKLINFLAIC